MAQKDSGDQEFSRQVLARAVELVHDIDRTPADRDLELLLGLREEGELSQEISTMALLAAVEGVSSSKRVASESVAMAVDEFRYRMLDETSIDGAVALAERANSLSSELRNLKNPEITTRQVLSMLGLYGLGTTGTVLTLNGLGMGLAALAITTAPISLVVTSLLFGATTYLPHHLRTKKRKEYLRRNLRDVKEIISFSNEPSSGDVILYEVPGIGHCMGYVKDRITKNGSELAVLYRKVDRDYSPEGKSIKVKREKVVFVMEPERRTDLGEVPSRTPLVIRENGGEIIDMGFAQRASRKKLNLSADLEGRFTYDRSALGYGAKRLRRGELEVKAYRPKLAA